MAFDLDVQPLAAAVPTPGAVDHTIIGLAPLSHSEKAELVAFQRRGWRFTRALDGADLPPGATDAGYGVLVRRAEGGLAIVQNHLVAAFVAGPVDPVAILDQFQPWIRLPYGDNLYRITASQPAAHADFQVAIEQEMTRLRGVAGAALLWVEPVFTFRLAVGEAELRESPFRSLVPPLAPVPPYDSPLQWQWPTIHLADAWSSANGKGAGAVVAVIDHGFFQSTLPPLVTPMISLQRDGSNRGNDWPGRPHGTFCAALVSSPLDGQSDNGVTPACGLVLVAVDDQMDSDGFGTAVSRCASAGADVISSSVSPYNGWPNLRTLQDAIKDVQNNGRNGKGCIVVWAVSNNEAPIAADDIAGYPDLLSVGPCTSDGARGPCGHGTGLDVVAPGIGVGGLYTLDGTHVFIQAQGGGASYATPIVAGIAALIVSARPTLTGVQVVGAIQDHCDPLQVSGEVEHGRVNADAAVKAALNLA
jgi:subtilisin family serine protease